MATQQLHPMAPVSFFSLLRLGNLFMAFFLLYAGVVQLNDPDWIVWLSFYLSGAALCARIAILSPPKPNPRFSSTEFLLNRLLFIMKQLTLAIGFCTVWLISRVYKEGGTLEMDVKTEVGRENLGLLIYSTWFLLVQKAGDFEMGRLEKLLIEETEQKDRRSKQEAHEKLPEKKALEVKNRENPLAMGFTMVAFAVLVLASAYMVPKFLLSAEILQAGDAGHCSGIGVCPSSP